jgi:hypothetical protein
VNTKFAVCLLSAVTVFGASHVNAQVGPPPHYRELVQMAECRTLSCLDSVWKGFPHGETTSRIVYFSRRMMIRPDVRSANGLLAAIPTTEADQLLFANFESWHEGVTQYDSDMEALSRIYGMWPRLVARAALLSRNPKTMLSYVGYLALAPHDIHSDFTGNAQLVCRKQPTLFRRAFHDLSVGDQKYIRAEVFDVDKCKAIFLSEAE